MSLKIFNRDLHRCLEKILLITIVGLLGGCSSDFTRLTEGLRGGAFRHSEIRRPVQRHPQPSVVQGGYRVIESGELPPPVSVSVPGTEGPDEFAEDNFSPDGAPAKDVIPEPISRTGDSYEYVVQKGDTLYDLSRDNNVSVERIKQENGLSGDMIRIGQTLNIPGKKGAQKSDNRAADEEQLKIPDPVKSDESEQKDLSLSQSDEQEETIDDPDHSEEETADEKTGESSEDISNENSRKTDNEDVGNVLSHEKEKDLRLAQMRWPVKGHILSHFGQREGTSVNDGIDVMVPEGTSVKAADDGVVIYADDGLKEFGNTVLIRHENNIVTVYGHNSKILVKRGQNVQRGEEIAKSGMSGNALAPRLHFEVRKQSKPVDPVQYLED